MEQQEGESEQISSQPETHNIENGDQNTPIDPSSHNLPDQPIDGQVVVENSANGDVILAGEHETKDNNEPMHPLTDSWSFWYVYSLSHHERKKKGKNYWKRDYNLHDVYTFTTIEDFWSMFNNIYSVKNLIANTDYCLFKDGIKPEWEDDRNKDGGKWVVTLPIEDDMEAECEYAWLQIILMMIGANVDKEVYEIINGAIFSIRDKHHRISIWISDNFNNIEPTLLKKVGTTVRTLTKLPMDYKLLYQVHKKAIQHNLDNEAFLTA
jgi:translation initiation factor 4E